MVEGRDQPEGSFAQQLNELEEGRYKNWNKKKIFIYVYYYFLLLLLIY
jgi:hypothetical protein